MFSSPNNSYNPFDQIGRSSSSFPLSDQNPSHSKIDPDPPFLFTFPSPFLGEHEISPLNQILLQNQTMDGYKCTMDQFDHKTDTTDKQGDHQPIATGAKSGPLIRRSRNLGVIPRRRTGKKDRHSKICTAQGIRDRRMRLSLQIARKFFDLQDMLGYDKASKTIEWLFTKSKKAIKELMKDHPRGMYNNNNMSNNTDAKSESFVSECEVVSGPIDENISNNDVKESVATAYTKSGRKPNLRSESREKARARARCRTREKMMVKILENSSKKSNPSENDDFQKLGFTNSLIFGGVDQESGFDNQERVSLYGNLYNSLEQQFGDVGTIEKFLGNSSIISCPNPDYHRSVSGYMDPNSNFMGFFGNWDLLNNIERTNSIPYAVANDQVSLGENPSSIYSATTQ